MGIPYRGTTGHGTYFITSSSFGKKCIFQTGRMASLLVEVLQHYRLARRFLLHEYVIMPDHFHTLLTPNETLERAMQLIKGGFSFRARKELGWVGEVWQNSFYDRRVRDAGEYVGFRKYIWNNPVKRGLVQTAEEFPYTSATLQLDAVPQRLKPEILVEARPQR